MKMTQKNSPVTKRLVSLLLSIILVATMVPALAFATGGEEPVSVGNEQGPEGGTGEGTGNTEGAGSTDGAGGEAVGDSLSTPAANTPTDTQGGAAATTPVEYVELASAPDRIADEVVLDKATTPYEIALVDAAALQSVKINDTVLLPEHAGDIIEDEDIEWWTKDNDTLVLVPSAVEELAVGSYTLTLGFAEGEETAELKVEDASETQDQSIEPLAEVQGGNSIALRVPDGGSGYIDTDDTATPGALVWPVSTPTMSFEVYATFKAGSSNRSITVMVPEGYTILSYSAKDVNGESEKVTDSTTKVSVTKLGLATPENSKLISSNLTAPDGTGDWFKQAITNYTGAGSSVEKTIYKLNGQIQYELYPTANDFLITLVLGIDYNRLPHNAEQHTLDDLTVEITNGSAEVSESLSTTVTGLAVSSLGVGTALVELDGSETVSKVFSTRNNIGSHASLTQNHLAETITYTVSYPKGISFVGFTESLTDVSEPNDSDGGTFGTDEHLAVTVDTTQATNTVTFTYTNVRTNHNGGMVLYWRVEDVEALIDEGSWADTDKTELVVNLPGSLSISSGATVFSSQTHNADVVNSVTLKKPNWKIDLRAMNRTRSNLNHDANKPYPYDYYLGGVHVRNLGPSQATDLTWTWTFADNLAVRAVSMPGLVGDDYTGVTVKVKTKGDTAGQARTLDCSDKTFSPTATQTSGQAGAKITAQDLGLADDEYIVELVLNQQTLTPTNTGGWYGYAYVYGSAHYYGCFQDGSDSGDATLTVSTKDSEQNDSILAAATDHTTIDWKNSDPGNVTNSTGSSQWFPGETVPVTTIFSASNGYASHQNEIVDPTIYISLPEGIELDINSMQAFSAAGNHKGEWFALDYAGSKKTTRTEDLGGGVTKDVVWTTYIFKSKNYQDMIALAANFYGSAYDATAAEKQIRLSYNLVVSSSCSTYSTLKQTDIVQLDLGQTVRGGTHYDTNNLAGKGTEYALAVAGVTAKSWSVVQKPGFIVNLGIRTAESDTAYYTYGGTDATIAPVTLSKNAEIQLTYENTDQNPYVAGSEIYLPIPKEGLVYDNYFNNIAGNPYADAYGSPSNNVTPEFNASLSLTSDIVLAGFDTYYAVDTNTSTNDTTDNINAVPYAASQWYSYADIAGSASLSFEDVTMIKFVANTELARGATGSTVFQVSVDSGAGLGDQNFWRSYQKGWKDAAGNGSWNYGAVIAAEPTKEGIKGMLFNDLNGNGIMELGEEFTSLSGMSGFLSGSGLTGLNIQINADGSFESLANDALGVVIPNEPYNLKAGTYELRIINNNTSAFGFTPGVSSEPSDGTDWYMDIEQKDIASGHTSASYFFTVEPGDALTPEFVGVGLTAPSTVTYVFSTGFTGLANATELVNYNSTPVSVPAPAATNIETGYDSSSIRWTLDKKVTLSSGTEVEAGTELTSTQLRTVKVTENLTATAVLKKLSYTVSVSVVDQTITGGSASTSASPVEYGESSTITATAAAGYVLDYMKVNNNEVTPLVSTTSGSYVYTYGLTNITENKTVVVKFKGMDVELIYDTNTNGDLSLDFDVATTSFVYGGVIGEANKPTNLAGDSDPARDHYTFAGWKLKGATAATDPLWSFSAGALVSPAVVGSGVAPVLSYTLELVAQWDPVLYKVTFDSAGAKEKDAIDALELDVPFGSVIKGTTGFPADPTKDGYDFAGWKMSTTGTPLLGTTTTMPGTAVKLTAQWAPKTYTISFAGLEGATNTGNTLKTGYKTGDADIVLADADARTGYTFKGWALSEATTQGAAKLISENNGGLNATIKQGSYGNVLATAIWDANSYEIVYEPNGGEPTTAYKDEAIFNTSYTYAAATTFKRQGYDFKYWTTQLNGGSSIAASSSITYTTPAGATLYAYWTPSTGTEYTVEHYLVSASGAVSFDSKDTLTGTTNNTATALPRAYASHTYAAGYNGSSNTGVIAADGSLVIKMYYTQNVYTVTFVDWNGSVLASRTNIPYGGSALAPSNPYRAGYTFAGWDKGFTNVTSNLTVNARYTIIPIATYTVTFVDWDGSVLSSQTVTRGGSATAPVNPTRTGYTFTGWDRGYTNVTSNITVTAQYSIHTYTVTFLGYNDEVLQTGTVNHGESATPPANPTRTGYRFTGWDKDSSTWTNVTADATIRATWNNETLTPGPGTTTPQTPDEPTGGTTQEILSQAAKEQGIPSIGVPLAAPAGFAAWALANLILAVLSIMLALVFAILRNFRRNDDRDEEEREERRRERAAQYAQTGAYAATDEEGTLRRRRGLGWIVATVILALAGVILFILTQDITLPMVWVDIWTIVNAILFVATLILGSIAVGRKKVDRKEEDDATAAQTV